MNTSKLLFLGMLVVLLAFATSAPGQCTPKLSCGNVAYFANGPLAGTQATCVRPGDELYYIVTVGLGLNDCRIVEGVVTLDLPDGRTLLLDDNLEMLPNNEQTYDTRDVEGWVNYVVDCNNLTPAGSIDPNSSSECDATSINSTGGRTPSTGSGEWLLFCYTPCIRVEKTPIPDYSKPGDTVIYRICVTNCSTGAGEVCDLNLYNVLLDDDLLGGLLNAPDSNFPPDLMLPPGETVCENFPYVVQPDDPDPLENCVTATGEDNVGTVVDDVNCASVDLVDPNFTIEKFCPEVSKIGDEACYTVVITNTGDVNMVIDDVNDSLVGDIGDCDGVILQPGEQCIADYCYLVPQGAPNPLPNTVTATLFVEVLGNRYTKSSEPCETPLVNPAIDLEKTVDPNIACPGETVTYTICIENTGDWPLENVAVEDPLLGPIYGSPLPGFPPVLFPGEIACADFPYTVPDDVPTCPETLQNCAEVTANAIDLGNPRDANDCAEICCEIPGGEGCTPGFWKNNADKHDASAWCTSLDDGTPIGPAVSFSSVFGVVIEVRTGGKKTNTVTDPTLLQALGANGGGINALARHATAALLNACSDCVNYPMGEAAIIAAVQEAVAAGDEAIQALHEELAYYNEAGCPVNQHGECVGVDEVDGIVIAE